jgi:hypothetical protein
MEELAAVPKHWYLDPTGMHKIFQELCQKNYIISFFVSYFITRFAKTVNLWLIIHVCLIKVLYNYICTVFQFYIRDIQLHYCPFDPLTRCWTDMSGTTASLCDVRSLSVDLKTG